MPLLDLVIIVAYMVGIVVLGIYSTRKQKLNSENYFLAGRGLNWMVVGAALFASNISTIHLVGLAASGFNEGLVWGNFEWMASFTLILLGLIFAPFYFKSKIKTLPEFLEKRYNSSVRSFLAFMGIIGALFVHIGMSLYAGAVVFETFFGINVYVSIIIISVLTGIYTIVGGLKAVVVTETLQTFILIIGSLTLTIFAFYALRDAGISSLDEFKAAVKPEQLSMLRSDEGGVSGLTWYAVFLGYPVLGIWYWCSDQTIVQRVLGAKSMNDAQKGPIFAGFLKILPLFIMVLPGVIAYVILRDKIVDSNQALPVLVTELLPVGLRGFMAAALLSALMSTIAAALNSCGTLVAFDIAKKINPKISDSGQVRIGKISAVVVMILAILWSTQGGRFSSIFEAINKIAASLAPPISTVFLLGVFSKRGTEKAAMSTLVIGFFAGLLVFILDFIPPLYGNQAVMTEVLGIPFMLQAWWLFVFCCIIYIVTSRFTAPPTPEQQRYIWKSPVAFIIGDRWTGVKDIRFAALLLLVTMIVLYTVFA
jgi:SSS family solute:Na+ symporter